MMPVDNTNAEVLVFRNNWQSSGIFPKLSEFFMAAAPLLLMNLLLFYFKIISRANPNDGNVIVWDYLKENIHKPWHCCGLSLGEQKKYVTNIWINYRTQEVSIIWKRTPKNHAIALQKWDFQLIDEDEAVIAKASVSSDNFICNTVFNCLFRS